MTLRPAGWHAPLLAAAALVAAALMPAARAEQKRIQIHAANGVVVGQVQEANVAPDGRKIFVPEPKGAGESLDEAADQDRKEKGDTVTTVRGDRIVGRVLTLESDGKLRLTSPDFEGEVVVLASALDRVELTPTQGPKGDDEALLSNGDRIVGELLAITPEDIIVESEATGPLKISRRIIESISFSRTTTVTLESHFAEGRMAPWSALGGGWTVSDGALQCISYGGLQTVFAKFEQQEPVTMEAQVQSTNGQYLNVELVLFADNKNGPYGHNSILARFYSSHFYLMSVQNGGQNSVTNRHMGRVLTNATLRAGYDPQESKLHVWVDSALLGEFPVPQKLAKGNYVMFCSRQPCRVTGLRVLRGIVPPSQAEGEPETDDHVVRFANKDRVAASDLALREGKLTLKTSFGEIGTQVDKVLNITFRSKGIEKPRRRKGDVWIETANSRYTLQFERLTPEHLLGKSSYLGEVKLLRSCLKRIRFNIYK